MSSPPRKLPLDAAAIMQSLPGTACRVLIMGPTGSGKSTLARALAGAAPGPVLGISADPGSPAFGVPGALTLAEWHSECWQPLDMEPLCTLNAARFRLPLVHAVHRLARQVCGRMLIVDAPGVTRGVAAAELLAGLADTCAADAVVVLDLEDTGLLPGDLARLGCSTFQVPRNPHARRPSKRDRDRARTGRWDAYLAGTRVADLDLDRLQVTGTAPPRQVPEAWQGRQVALLRGSRPQLMGEVVRLVEDTLTVRLPDAPDDADTLLIRDAQRSAVGVLVTASPPADGPRWSETRVRRMLHPSDESWRAPLEISAGGVVVALVNGVLGDPLLMLTVPNVHHRLLFDLGEASALPVKMLHAVRDVFVSHAHIDHIGGFPTLLRARLSGNPPPCRLYGPPGIHGHIAGFVAGVRWDRIGDTGPVFLVAEVHDDALHWCRIQPGRDPEDLPHTPSEQGVLLREAGFRVRAGTLDHGIPVLSFLLELADTLHVRREALARRGLRPGPWIGELKRKLARGETSATVGLHDGSRGTVGVLGEALIDVMPGTRIAYATDLADTAANRRVLSNLAAGADLLVCEATFLIDDADQARATRHLTTRACIEIAAQAKVRRLLPFHFSRRYSRRLSLVYDEIQDAARAHGLTGAVVSP